MGGLNSKGTLFVSAGRHQVDSFDLTLTTLDTTGAALERNDVSFHGTLGLAPAWQLTSTVTSYWNTQTGRSVGELGPEEDRVPGNAQTYGVSAGWRDGFTDIGRVPCLPRPLSGNHRELAAQYRADGARAGRSSFRA